MQTKRRQVEYLDHSRVRIMCASSFAELWTGERQAGVQTDMQADMQADKQTGVCRQAEYVDNSGEG
jgi:hypothetical protein